ncbi:hypothetical protein WA588_003498 [Blastocystis sp. NMH]
MSAVSKPYGDIQMCDIGLNFTDEVYDGVYRGKVKHPSDRKEVLERAWNVGVSKIMITAGNLEETKQALALARTDPRLYSTVGIHPTRCSEFKEEEADSIIAELIALAKEGKEMKKIVAIGEFGLDYDRLFFCDKERQNKYFRKQFEIVRAVDLPLFLHERSCDDDFIQVFNDMDPEHKLRGCVHSFTGSKEMAKRLLSMGFYIGFNGSGMRTEESLDVIKSVPLEKILIETDGPYCAITSAHASYAYVKTKFESKRVEKYDPKYLVKGRVEPCCVLSVLEVIAAVHGVSVEEAAKIIYRNTLELYFPWELCLVCWNQ